MIVQPDYLLEKHICNTLEHMCSQHSNGSNNEGKIKEEEGKNNSLRIFIENSEVKILVMVSNRSRFDCTV